MQKPRQAGLTIRARVATDLDRLRTTYLPTLSATVAGAGTDYPYRATVAREEFARRQGHERERTYSKVWGVLQELEDTAS